MSRVDPEKAFDWFDGFLNLAGWRFAASIAASLLLTIGLVVAGITEDLSPYGPVQGVVTTVYTFPWILLAIPLQFLLGSALLAFAFSDLHVHYMAFSLRFFALTGTSFGAFLYAAFALLFVTPAGVLALGFYLSAIAILAICAMSRLMTQNQRNIVVEVWGDGVGLLAALFYVLLVAGLNIVFFGGVTYALIHEGVVDPRASAQRDGVTLSSSCLFYVHTLLASLPFGDVPKAFNWKPPFEYQQSAFGTAIVAFRILVITPCLAFVVFAWKHRAGSQAPADPTHSDASTASLPHEANK